MISSPGCSGECAVNLLLGFWTWLQLHMLQAYKQDEKTQPEQPLGLAYYCTRLNTLYCCTLGRSRQDSSSYILSLPFSAESNPPIIWVVYLVMKAMEVSLLYSRKGWLTVWPTVCSYWFQCLLLHSLSHLMPLHSYRNLATGIVAGTGGEDYEYNSCFSLFRCEIMLTVSPTWCSCMDEYGV